GCGGAGAQGWRGWPRCSWVRGAAGGDWDRAQVQQEPSAETNEGIGVTINCSHPNIQTGEFIHWYRQLPGRGPSFLAFILKGSKELQAPPGRLSVAADRRSSALWLARPRRGDAAVYYCTPASKSL
uniref:Ig-like domain-containing protein n=1 Tax=Strix occidentalis caurina TaxID=311401 RepID=A0A8D0ETR7_STROC